MNYKLLKAKMDKFFATVTAEELMDSFKKLGYEFRDMTGEEIAEYRAKQRRENCSACSMLKAKVKFRKAPKHTCGL